jgi:hypothetical protein
MIQACNIVVVIPTRFPVRTNEPSGRVRDWGDSVCVQRDSPTFKIRKLSKGEQRLELDMIGGPRPAPVKLR